MRLKRKLYSFNPIKKLRDHLGKKSNEYKDRDEKILRSLDKEAKKNGISAVVVNDKYPGASVVDTKTGKKAILLNRQTTGIPHYAHEVGHSYYLIGEGKDKLGGKIHKADQKIKNSYRNLVGLNKEDLTKEQKEKLNKRAKKTRGVVGSSVSGLSGVVAGYKAEEEKEKGNKKKANIIKASSLAVPVLGHAPQIGSEIAASKKGMEYLKKAGASKQQLKGSRKSMGYALGTYGVNLGKNLIINEGGQLVGKGAYKLTHKKKKDKGRDS